MEVVVNGTSSQCVFSRLYIFEVWCSKKGKGTIKANQVFDEVVTHIEMEGTESMFCELSKRINYICSKLVLMWRKNARLKSLVLKNYSPWLSIKEVVPLNEAVSLQNETRNSGLKRKRGRPKTDFSQSSKRTKQRRLAVLAENDDSFANALRSAECEPKQVLMEVNITEVISLMMETNLTKHQYLLIREFINAKLSFSLLPSYEKVVKEKKKSYPDTITVNESCAEVELQSLLDHTASRILDLQSEVLDNINDDCGNDLILIGKWGFDGSSGYNEYKQKFKNKNLEDSNLFVTSYVPLRLMTKDTAYQKSKIIWKNPRPSSTRYCRPIRFQLKKETNQTSINERNYFMQKINTLKNTEYLNFERKIYVEHKLQLTMVDGKVCNALSETSSAKCYICEAKPKEMNNLEKCLERSVKKEHFEFGLSPLHAYIRFFEYFIHISYRSEDKHKILKRKREIQKMFKDKMGLIVDRPKVGGSGTSNDGNTARRFFNNVDLSAEITGLDKDLLLRCATLLQAMSSGYEINSTKFNTYALDTARSLTQKYPWYYLPPSVHKVLIHGSDIIDNALLSIGELSEEAAEAKNKDIKRFRLKHTRKTSRIATNEDLLNRLLLSSDPFVTGQRKLPCSKKSTLLTSVFDLLEDI